MKKHFGIYCIRNKITDKKYIGKTIEIFQKRWFNHRSFLRGNKHPNVYMQREWNKYGEDNFEFLIIEQFDIAIRNEYNYDELNRKICELEIYYIKKYNTYKNGYNMTTGGEGTCGIIITEKHKKAIAEKNRINMTGRKHSEETKKKMSESHKGYIKTEEHRKHLSEALKGKTVSEETRIKIRNQCNKYKYSSCKNKKEDILNIKKDFMNGMNALQISEKYKIKIKTIQSILYENRWKEVFPDGWKEFRNKRKYKK